MACKIASSASAYVTEINYQAPAADPEFLNKDRKGGCGI